MTIMIIAHFEEVCLCNGVHIRSKNSHQLWPSFFIIAFSCSLKELRNGILRIIPVWSLFCLIRVYVALHFLQFILENLFFVFLYFLQCFLLWIKSFESRHYKYVFWCYVILLLNFVRKSCSDFIKIHLMKSIYKNYIV